MTDLAEGRYRLPWEDEVRITDGTACGFPDADAQLLRRPAAEAAE